MRSFIRGLSFIVWGLECTTENISTSGDCEFQTRICEMFVILGHYTVASRTTFSYTVAVDPLIYETKLKVFEAVEAATILLYEGVLLELWIIMKHYCFCEFYLEPL